jgi:hypothetical protein
MHEPRTIRFIRREEADGWRVKVYGIGTHAPDARPEFVDATVAKAREVLPDGGGHGFVIAHDAKGAGLGLVYWWANDNEIHGRFYASPLDEPAALEPIDNDGLACVWELEVLDFERRAWLEHVLKRGDHDAYAAASAPEAVL